MTTGQVLNKLLKELAVERREWEQYQDRGVFSDRFCDGNLNHIAHMTGRLERWRKRIREEAP